MEIIAIKILSGNNTAIAIEKESCIYMDPGYLNMRDLTKASYSAGGSDHCVYGIWYKPNSKKWNFPIVESDIFVPMTAVVSIALK